MKVSVYEESISLLTPTHRMPADKYTQFSSGGRMYVSPLQKLKRSILDLRILGRVESRHKMNRKERNLLKYRTLPTLTPELSPPSPQNTWIFLPRQEIRKVSSEGTEQSQRKSPPQRDVWPCLHPNIQKWGLHTMRLLIPKKLLTTLKNKPIQTTKSDQRWGNHERLKSDIKRPIWYLKYDCWTKALNRGLQKSPGK